MKLKMVKEGLMITNDCGEDLLIPKTDKEIVITSPNKCSSQTIKDYQILNRALDLAVERNNKRCYASDCEICEFNNINDCNSIGRDIYIELAEKELYGNK